MGTACTPHSALARSCHRRTCGVMCHAVLWQLLRSRANGAASGNAVAVVSTQVDRASPARTQTAAESTPQAPSPSLAAVSTSIDGHARKGIEPAPCLISADAPCAVLAHSGIEVYQRAAATSKPSTARLLRAVRSCWRDWGCRLADSWAQHTALGPGSLLPPSPAMCGAGSQRHRGVPARCCYQQTEYGRSVACSTELLA